MQQALDRRQPPARFRPQLREIPLQRGYGLAANGENNWRGTSRDHRSSPVASCETPGSGVLVGGETEPDRAAGQDIQAGPAAPPTGPAVLGDVELSAAPAAETLVPAGAPDEAPDDPPGSEDAERVHQPTTDVSGDQGDAAVVPTAGDLGSGDPPVVSDQAWAWMEPLLPSSTGRRGGRWRDHRQVVEAISWKFRTGTPWRELPARFGPWQTAYERLSRWSADGTWARLLARARIDADAAGELDWLVAVDSTRVRVPQQRAGARLVASDVATASPENPETGAAA